jgi:hypothetical protein
MSNQFLTIPRELIESVCKLLDCVSIIMLATSSDHLYKLLVPYLKLNNIPRRATCADVAKLGNLDLLIYSEKILLWPTDPHDILEYSIRGGFLELVQYTHEKQSVFKICSLENYYLPHHSISLAISYGQINILQWLIKEYAWMNIFYKQTTPPFHMNDLFLSISRATKLGNLEILKVTNELYSLANDVNIWRNASHHGRLNIIKWMYTKLTNDSPIKQNPSIVHLCLINGHIELFDWFLANSFIFDMTRYINNISDISWLIKPMEDRSQTEIDTFIKGFKHLQSVQGDDILQELPQKLQEIVRNRKN